MATATTAAKRCVSCHKDVTNGKRMKDSSGRYWCLDCGAADQRKKGGGGETCASCLEQFPASKLTRFGTSKLCPGCAKRRTAGPGLLASLRQSLSGGGGGGGSADKARMVKMLAVAGLLALVAALRFFKVF
jgi:hypothetical protein